MSDAPEGKPKAKPRIARGGIESIAADHDRYENHGMASADVGYKTVLYSNHGSDSIAGNQQCDLNNWLDQRDWYLINVVRKEFIRTGDRYFQFSGDLYIPKTNPSKVAVTDIQVGETNRERRA